MKKTDFISKVNPLIILLIFIFILTGSGSIIMIKLFSASSNLADNSLNKTVLAFSTYYSSNDVSSYNSLIKNKNFISEIAADTYTADGNGNVSGLVPNNQISYSNAHGINTYAMITNNFSSSIAKKILESKANRDSLINNILKAVEKNGYKGVNIDFENVYSYDRAYLTTFMNELYTLLHSNGYIVTISVPAKTDNDTKNEWYGAFDYKSLSNYCDELIIMAYDEHYQGGSPGPIASIGWVQNIIDYAITVIPRSKILIGIAAYGYDWSSKGTKAYGMDGINTIASTYNAKIKFDATSKSPYFNYIDKNDIKHTVWFENSTSIGYKLDLVNNYDLKGIAFWRLGLESSDFWTTINSRFKK